MYTVYIYTVRITHIYPHTLLQILTDICIQRFVVGERRIRLRKNWMDNIMEWGWGQKWIRPNNWRLHGTVTDGEELVLPRFILPL